MTTYFHHTYQYFFFFFARARLHRAALEVAPLKDLQEKPSVFPQGYAEVTLATGNIAW